MTRLAKKGLLGLFCLVLGGDVGAVEKGPSTFEIEAESFLLENGVWVTVYEDPLAAGVSLDLRVGVGAGQDPESFPGMAHLLEHLMFSGSRYVPDGEFDRLLEEAGGVSNAWTDHDWTTYQVTAPREALDLVLFLEAERIATFAGALDQARIDRAVQVIEQERFGQTNGGLAAQFNQLLYPPEHPYRRRVLGSGAALKGATVDDVVAFYARWMVPQNVQVVVGGNVSRIEVEKRVGHWFGGLGSTANQDTPLPGTQSHDASNGERSREYGERWWSTGNTSVPTLYAVWPTVVRGDPREPALDLLADAWAESLQEVAPAGMTVRVWTQNRKLGGVFVAELRSEDGSLRGMDRWLDRQRKRFLQEVSNWGPSDLDRVRAKRTLRLSRDLVDLEQRVAVLAECLSWSGMSEAGRKNGCMGIDMARIADVELEHAKGGGVELLGMEPAFYLSEVPGGKQSLALRRANRLWLDVPEGLDAPLPTHGPVHEIDPYAGTTEGADFWTAPIVPTLEPPVGIVPSVHSLSDGTTVWIVENHAMPLVLMEMSLGQGWLGDPDGVPLRLAGEIMQKGGRNQDDAFRLGIGALRGWMEVSALPGTEADAIRQAREAFESPELRRKDLRVVKHAWAAREHRQRNDMKWVHDTMVSHASYGAEHVLNTRVNPTSIRRATPKKIRAAHQGWLATGRSTIVVVGDARPEDLLPVLERHWTGLGGQSSQDGGPNRRVDAAPPPPVDYEPPKLVLVDWPGATQAIVSMSTKAPGLMDSDRLGAEMVGEIIAGAYTSRLLQILREEEGWSYAVENRFRVWPSHGRWHVSTAVGPENVGATLERMAGELDGWGVKSPTNDEANMARNGALHAVAVEQGSNQALLDTHGVSLSLGLPADYIRQKLDAIQDTDASSLREVGQALCADDGRVWVVTGDVEELEAALEGVGWKPDRVVFPVWDQ